MYLGEALLPGAGEAIARLRALDRRIAFLSNNPTRTPAEYAAKLTALGVPATEGDVINSTQVLVEMLREEAPGARVFPIGEAPLHEALAAAGFVLERDASRVDVVIASFDRTFAYPKLQVAFDAIRAGARFLATNGDRYCPVPGGGEPDAAAVIAAIEACTGVACEAIVGKPSAHAAATILRTLELDPEECLMTGDRLETDVEMGLRAGMDAALTLTGATDRDELEASPVRPTCVVTGLAELVPPDA